MKSKRTFQNKFHHRCQFEVQVYRDFGREINSRSRLVSRLHQEIDHECYNLPPNLLFKLRRRCINQNKAKVHTILLIVIYTITMSQTSFGHISINSLIILTVLTAMESPQEDLSIDASHVSRRSILAEISGRSTSNHYSTVY